MTVVSSAKRIENKMLDALDFWMFLLLFVVHNCRNEAYTSLKVTLL